ncbi:MAG TPA: hypothetical protein VFK38_00795 [Candidatus Limnocylindrales bacterium]|nr:hypothetical protein [Candidatus Limnocylindrales bacterium]
MNESIKPDQRLPRDEAVRRDVLEPESDSSEEKDTEGHSLLAYELGRTVARDRSREAEEAARKARLRHDADEKRKR